MYYTVYKITNVLNNKVYIGCHHTSDLNDNYMGSGTQIIRAIKKYGKENFKKEYLAIFDNKDDMLEMEAQLVNEKFIQREDTYNIIKGGGSSVGFITVKNEEGRIFLVPVDDPRYIIGELIPHTKGRKHTPEAKKKMREAQKNKLKELNIPYFGYDKGYIPSNFKHTKDSIEKIKKAHTGKHTGKHNAFFRKTWVTDTLLNKCYAISLDVLDEELKKPGVIKGNIRNIQQYKQNLQNRVLYILKKERDKKENIEKRKDMFKKLYIQYVKSTYKSIESFVKDGNYNRTYNTLVSYWKEYIPGYPECCKIDKQKYTAE